MQSRDDFSNARSDGRVVRVLKDGYWDRTEVIALADGSQRVRKCTKGAAFGPWGVQSLRREIRYLQALPAEARSIFPPLLAAWDEDRNGGPEVGYEMPFYADHLDAGNLARRGALAQAEIDALQDVLAESVLERLHEPVPVEHSLAVHVRSVVELAWTELEKDPALATLINAADIDLNGAHACGPRAAFASIVSETDALAALQAQPCVRLHGDLFLENILWRSQSPEQGSAPLAEGSVAPLSPPSPGCGATSERRATSSDACAPRLILVDPVSVAGVASGPAVFDLVKYESYATGELLALRSECVEVGGFEAAAAPHRYYCQIRWDDPLLRPLRARDWHTRFRRAFEARHGPVDRRLYRLIDGYFSAAMAVNTGGAQRRARLLKATAEFNAVLAGC